MRTDVGRAAALTTTAAGFITAVASAGAATVLTAIYRPSPPAGFGQVASAAVERSAQWRDLHLWAGLGLVASTMTLLAVVTLWTLGGHGPSRPLPVLIASSVAALAAGVTLVTRGLVEWDQLAMSAVTVGTDIDGYWTAAFGSGVAFVLVGGAEVSQGTYAVALVVHLAAPVVSGIALAAVGVTLLRGPRGAASRLP